MDYSPIAELFSYTFLYYAKFPLFLMFVWVPLSIMFRSFNFRRFL